jgi:hypothetical protein
MKTQTQGNYGETETTCGYGGRSLGSHTRISSQRILVHDSGNALPAKRSDKKQI